MGNAGTGVPHRVERVSPHCHLPAHCCPALFSNRHPPILFPVQKNMSVYQGGVEAANFKTLTQDIPAVIERTRNSEAGLGSLHFTNPNAFAPGNDMSDGAGL